jgi:glycosyltransferase involved in cell wall biosynthesis
MQCIVNARVLAHPDVTGVQQYARNLLAEMKRLSPEIRLARPRIASGVSGHIWEQFRLTGLAEGFDVLFCPANTGPWRPMRSVKLVVTLHCLRFLRHPRSYRRSFRAYYRFAIPRVLRLADAVLTVSHAAAGEIAEIFPFAARKLHVVEPGVDEVFRSNGAEHRERAVLFVGSLAPAKNLPLLLRAMIEMKGRLDHEVWIVGSPSPAMRDDPQIAGLVRRLGERRVRCFGQVNEPARLAEIYGRAEMLVFPTRYESFGLPALEAMASGLPVIASDISALRELLSDSGELFDTGEGPAALGGRILALAEDPDRRLAMGRAGREQSREMTWLRCARRTLEVIGSVS